MPHDSALSASSSRTRESIRIAWAPGGLCFLLQFSICGRYGYFRDELYYLACSDHLAFGYVDLAPLIAWLARGSRILFGDSLHAIRFLPTLANGLEVVLTGYITRELGGRGWAIFFACLGVFVAPVILGNGTRLAMNPLEPLFWMGCVYVLLLALNGDAPRLLVWCGVLIGFGLENKHSAVFFLGALVLALLLSPERHILASKWFWLAFATAFLIAVPNVIWQIAHHFPTLEDLSNVKHTHKNVELPPLPFLKQQIMMLNPLNAPLWLAGLGFLLFHRGARRLRWMGFAYLIFLAVMMVLKGKDYYLAPIYPMLYAAGGVLWEKLAEVSVSLRWVRVALPCVVLIGGVISAPLALPILRPDKIASYMQALGIGMSRTEHGMQSALPQHFADQFGWQEMVATVAGVYYSLPPEQRAKTAILGGNYGGAGAIDFFGTRYGLPKSISAHQNYYYWGPREYTGESIILLEWSEKVARNVCGSVDVGPRIEFPYTMGWEHYNVLICRDTKNPLPELWPRLKVWN